MIAVVGALEFLSPWPGWAALLWAAASVVFIVSLYRGERLSDRRGLRWFLMATRLALAALLMAFLSGPVWVVEEAAPASRSVAVLVDESESMSLADLPSMEGVAAPSRIEAVRRLLGEGAWGKRLPGSPRVLYWGFSDRTRFLGIQGADAAQALGRSTALGDAIQGVLAESDASLAAIFVVTDGRANCGADALAAARLAAARGVRVYAIGAGDPAGTRDVAVSALTANDVALLNDQVRFTARVRSRRCEGVSLRVILSEEGRDVAERQVSLREGIAEEVRFLHKVAEAGRRRFAARVEPVAGEISRENNEAARCVEVVDAKLKVLLVDGYPRWEFQYLRNALKRDPVVEVSVLQEDADLDFFPEGTLPIRNFPGSMREMSGYDVIVLGDVSPGFLSAQAAQTLVRFVQDRAGGVLFLAGRRHRAPQSLRDTALEKILPVFLHGAVEEREAYAGAGSPLTTPLKWRRTAAGAAAGLADISDSEEDPRFWETLPGFFWGAPLAKLKPLATTALEGVDPEGGAAPLPVLVWQYAGAGRAGLLATDETWRWRAGLDDAVFYRFWGTLLRDLSRNRFYGHGSRFRLETGGRQQFTLGETIPLSAQAFDEAGEPVAWESLEVLCPRGERGPDRVRLERDAATPGGFAGAYTPVEPGTYDFSIAVDGASQATVSCDVVVPRIEFAEPDLDEVFLRALATAGKGAYHWIGEPGARGPAFEGGAPFSKVGRRETTLWDTAPSYAFVVLLLSLEWFLRRLHRAA